MVTTHLLHKFEKKNADHNTMIGLLRFVSRFKLVQNLAGCLIQSNLCVGALILRASISSYGAKSQEN
jgi:hypothetical protein